MLIEMKHETLETLVPINTPNYAANKLEQLYKIVQNSRMKSKLFQF